MNKLATAVLGLGVLAIGSAWADEMPIEEACTPMDSASFYQIIRLSPEDDAGKKYQQLIEAIEAFGKKHQLQEFKITAQDASLNRSGYGTDEMELSISASVEYLPDYSVLSAFATELKLASVSVSRTYSGDCY